MVMKFNVVASPPYPLLHNPPHVLTSQSSDPSYDFQVTFRVHKPTIFDVKALAMFEDAASHSKQYLKLLPIHPKLSIP